MPVPSSLNDLSTTPALNSPAGSESPALIDDYLRTQAAFIKQVDVSVSTNASSLSAGHGASLVGFMAQSVTGTAQSGSTSTTIKLATTASATDDAYNGQTVQITGGTGSGQSRVIIDYVGSTRVATVAAWTTTPDATSTYNVAVATTVQSKLRESVSVKDFGAVGDGVADDTAAIQAALAAASNVYMPPGVYKITDTLKLTKDGQQLIGSGRNWVASATNGTHILWAGVSTKDVVELDSERVDGGAGSGVLVGAVLSSFGLSFAEGFAARNAIFVRDGVFHSTIENIYMRPYAGNAPTDSMLKLHSGGGYSYPLGIKVRDVVIRGDMLTYTLGPVPRGVWVQSALESVFENVRVFDCEDGWVIGDDAPNYRNVSNVNFIACHSEMGPPRDNSTASGCSIRFYAGSYINFYGSKFNSSAGLDDAGNAHRCIRVNGSTGTPIGSADLLGVSFDGCSFWGFGISDYAIQVGTGSVAQSLVFAKCQFINFEEGIVLSPSPATPQIAFSDCNFYRSLFNGSQASSYAAFGSKTGAQTINATSRLVLESNEGVPTTQSAFLIGSLTSNDSKAVLVTAVQQAYSNYGMEIGLFNPDASTATIGADNVVRLRPILDSEIIAQNKKDVAAIGLINNGAVYSTDIVVPGAAFGDHVFASIRFPKHAGSANLDGAMLSAYVTSANTVRVQIMNRRGAGFTPPANATFYACKALPRFDIYQITTYDAPSINNVTQLMNDVTVTGAAVGDLVTVAPSADIQGLFLRGVVKAADTVTLVFYNQTGAAVDLPSMNYGIGVIKVPTAV